MVAQKPLWQRVFRHFLEKASRYNHHSDHVNRRGRQNRFPRLYFFTPFQSKWHIFEFYQMVYLELLSPLGLLGSFLRDRLQGAEENWKAAGFPVQRWDGNPHNNVIMQRKSPAGRADGEQFAGSWACGLFAYSDDVRKFIDFTVRRQKSQQNTIPLVSFLLYKQRTWMSTVT